jgi:hypothetical protein
MADFFGLEIKNAEGEVDSLRSIDEISKVISVLKPKSSPYKLIRIGGNEDGAYLLPNDLTNIKACFSPGVSDFKTFEDDLTFLYKIQCHMCDKSTDPEKLKTPLVDGMQTFKKKWLDVNNADDSISLEEWVMAYSPNPKDDLILQMDIEGAEYKNLFNTSEEILKRFRIMVIEFHGLDNITNPQVLSEVLLPVFSKIDKYFQCVHAHANNCCNNYIVPPGTTINIPRLIELTFLRKDRFLNNSAKQLQPIYIPHPSDIINVPDKPPLFLNKAWSAEKRSFKSQGKIIRDWFYYILYILDRTARNAKMFLNELGVTKAKSKTESDL